MKGTYILKSIFAFIMAGVLFSCENSMETVRKISSVDTLAMATADSVEFFHSDSGRLQMKLITPIMLKFGGDNPYTEFPEGFEVFFFDTTGQKVSKIVAGYGINYESKKVLEARHNVVIYNFRTHEQLNTENLIWNKKKKEIFSPTFVKITTPDKVVFGDSLHATESFDKRTIYGVRATIEVEEDSLQ